MGNTDTVEETQIEIRTALLSLSKEELAEVGKYLKVLDGESKSKLTLIKLVTAITEDDKLDQLEDKGLSTLLDIMDKITELHKATTTASNGGSTKTTTESVPTASVGNSAVNSDLSLFRREFKISGQIGKINLKDKLSFSSLIYQIENGIKRGYKEGDIVDAVVRAITPGLYMRSYLEGRENLTLPNLRSVLRSHFEVKPPRDLFKLLNTTAQGPGETPQDFLIRLLDLRQKTLFAAQEVESGVRYDPAMIRETCLYTLATGLNSEFLQSEIKTELKENPSVSDEELIEKLNIASQQEADRREKLKINRSNARVQSLETDPLLPLEAAPKKSSPPKNKLPEEVMQIKEELASLKELKADIASIKETLQLRQSQPNRPVTEGQSRTWGKCFNCCKAGIEYCTHCWTCGDSSHIRPNCPSRRTQSENGKGVTSVRDVQ